jgi:hypothetical protein
VCEGLQVPGTLGLWGWVGRDDELEERYLLLSIAWPLRGCVLFEEEREELGIY